MQLYCWCVDVVNTRKQCISRVIPFHTSGSLSINHNNFEIQYYNQSPFSSSVFVVPKVVFGERERERERDERKEGAITIITPKQY